MISTRRRGGMMTRMWVRRSAYGLDTCIDARCTAADAHCTLICFLQGNYHSPLAVLVYINPDEVSHTVLICKVSFTLRYVVPYALRCRKTFIAIAVGYSAFSAFAAARWRVVVCVAYKWSVCCLSVCNIGSISSPTCTLAIWWSSWWSSCKILRRSSQGNPSIGGVKRKTFTRIRCTTSNFSRDCRPSSSIFIVHKHSLQNWCVFLLCWT